MDTVQLRCLYPRSAVINNCHFSEQIKTRELRSESGSSGSRHVFTNNEFRRQRTATGRYTPKYWLEEDYINPKLTYFVIEFSVPKLINGENVTPFHACISIVRAELHKFFSEIGVNICPGDLTRTVPSVIAFGENLNMTKICTCHQAIRILSQFNYRQRSKTRTITFSEDGEELHYGNKYSTFKVYSKLPEVATNGHTTQEKQITELVRVNGYLFRGEKVSELLRFELTLKNRDAIRKRTHVILNGKEPTFESLLDSSLWLSLVRSEVDSIFNSPIPRLVFLANLGQPEINKYIEKFVPQGKRRLLTIGGLSILQQEGLAGLRRYYAKTYKSRQSWYNHLQTYQEIDRLFNIQNGELLNSQTIHYAVLNHFKISPSYAQTLF